MVTLSEAKAYMQITSSAYDALITMYIAQVSAAIESFCDNIFNGVTVITDEYIDTTQPGEGITLRGFPVSNVVLKHGADILQQGIDYDIDFASGTIYFLNNPERGTNKYTVSYSVGYPINDVPQVLKTIALNAVKALFDTNVASSTSGSVPQKVASKKIGDFQVNYINEFDTGTNSTNIVQKIITEHAKILNKYRRFGV